MFRIDKSHPWPPEIDLATVRETIAYIEGDMRRVPEFDRIADALAAALEEIESVGQRTPVAPFHARTPSSFAARFLPRR